jgi:hypothetical protein
MDENQELRQLWTRSYQVGVVVRDLDQAVAFYESAGVGPFGEGPSAHARDRRIYGELQQDVEVKGLITQMGNIEFELLQPVRGQSLQKEHLDTHGEGVVHICSHIDNLDRGIELMTSRGFPVISSAHLEDGGRFAYFDTRRVGGVILELFQPGSAWS